MAVNVLAFILLLSLIELDDLFYKLRDHFYFLTDSPAIRAFDIPVRVYLPVMKDGSKTEVNLLVDQ